MVGSNFSFDKKYTKEEIAKLFDPSTYTDLSSDDTYDDSAVDYVNDIDPVDDGEHFYRDDGVKKEEINIVSITPQEWFDEFHILFEQVKSEDWERVHYNKVKIHQEKMFGILEKAQHLTFASPDELVTSLNRFFQFLEQTDVCGVVDDFCHAYDGAPMDDALLGYITDAVLCSPVYPQLTTQQSDALFTLCTRWFSSAGQLSVIEYARGSEDEKGTLYEWFSDDLEYYFENQDSETHKKIRGILDMLRVFGEKGSTYVIDTLCDLLRNGGLSLRRDMAPIFSCIDPQYAVQKIQTLLQDQSTEKDTAVSIDEKLYRRDLAIVLSRIEIGNMPISENTAKYIDQLIVLESQRDLSGFVRKLTHRNQFGVISPDGVLEGVGVATSGDNNSLRVRIESIALEHIVANPAPKGTREYEAQQEMLQLFQRSYSQFVSEREHAVLSTEMSMLPLRDQVGIVVQYQKHASKEQWHDIEAFCLRYGSAAIRACGMLRRADVTVDMIAKLPQAFADTSDFFTAIEAYARLAERIDVLRHATTASGERYEYSVCAEVEKRLEDLLLSLHSREHGSITHEGAQRLFGDIQADVALFASLVRSVRTQNAQEARDVLHRLDAQVHRGGSFSFDMKDALQAMIVRNYIDDNGDVREYGRAVAVPSLMNALDDERNTFYLLMHEQKPVAFVRFEDRGEYYYGGSFNVSSDAQNSGIGEIFLTNVLDQIGKEQKPIKAIAEVDKPIGARYVNQFGFVVTGIEQNKQGTGVSVLHLEKSQEFHLDQLNDTGMTVTVVPEDTISQQSYQLLQSYLDKGYVGTRIVRNGTQITIHLSEVLDSRKQYSKVA